MRPKIYSVKEVARVELRVSHSVIERLFDRGLFVPADEGDLLAIEHLVSIGLATSDSAKPKATPRKEHTK